MPEEWQLMDEKHRIDNLQEHLQYRSKLICPVLLVIHTEIPFLSSHDISNNYASAIMIIEISVINDLGWTYLCMH